MGRYQTYQLQRDEFGINGDKSAGLRYLIGSQIDVLDLGRIAMPRRSESSCVHPHIARHHTL